MASGNPVLRLFLLLPLLLVAAFGVQGTAPEMPTGLQVKGMDSHFELKWETNAESDVTEYHLYQSKDNQTWQRGQIIYNALTYAIVFTGRKDTTLNFRLVAVNSQGESSLPSAVAQASTREYSDEELLDMVQEYTFRYFWDFAHPFSGLARERNVNSPVTIGGSGFGVMAILVGIHRGFITRAEGAARMQKIVSFLAKADRFKGVWPHWMNGQTGKTVPFSALDNGGDLVETSFMLQGLLTARQYFDQNSPAENKLREDITTLWSEVDFNWYRKQVNQVLWWHWSPDNGWAMNFQIRGFNETHIVYLLALSAPDPSKRVPAGLYPNGWAGNSGYRNGNSYYGVKLDVGEPNGGPLFFSHYSYQGFDPRCLKDNYTNYFKRNIAHTLINRAYCIANPKNYKGYSADCWGLTASDTYNGYQAHAPGGPDNGTITPTAALSSMPYTPTESLQALKHFYRVLGARTWGWYGFYDAFNQSRDWWASSYLAIDQGPIINMIENYRSGLLWKYFMQDANVQEGLRAAGFIEDTVDCLTSASSDLNIQQPIFDLFPNPSSREIQLVFKNKTASRLIQAEILDGSGKVLYRYTFSVPGDQGWKTKLDLPELNSGVYFLRLTGDDFSTSKPIIVQH